MNLEIKNELVALLVLLRRKAEQQSMRSKNYQPTISTRKVIEMVRSAGKPFSYSQLNALRDDPAIGGFIADLNRDQLTIALDDADTQQQQADDFGAEQDPGFTDDDTADLAAAADGDAGGGEFDLDPNAELPANDSGAPAGELDAAQPTVADLDDPSSTDFGSSVPPVDTHKVSKMAKRALNKRR